MEELPIGIRIKNFRESKGLSKKAFAKKHNLDIDNYYKWEKGTKPSDPKDYKKLESILKGTSEIMEDKLSETAERFLKLIESQQRAIEMLAEKVPIEPDINDPAKKILPSEKTLKSI